MDITNLLRVLYTLFCVTLLSGSVDGIHKRKPRDKATPSPRPLKKKGSSARGSSRSPGGEGQCKGDTGGCGGCGGCGGMCLVGPPGPAGPPGAQGIQGIQGVQGVQGSNGLHGHPGNMGTKGQKGE